MPNHCNENPIPIWWKIQHLLTDTSHPALPDYEMILRRLQIGFNQIYFTCNSRRLNWFGLVWFIFSVGYWIIKSGIYDAFAYWFVSRWVFIDKIICYWSDFRLLKFLSSCLDLLYTCLHVLSAQSQPVISLTIPVFSLKIPMCYSFILWHVQLCLLELTPYRILLYSISMYAIYLYALVVHSLVYYLLITLSNPKHKQYTSCLPVYRSSPALNLFHHACYLE